MRAISRPAASTCSDGATSGPPCAPSAVKRAVVIRMAISFSRQLTQRLSLVSRFKAGVNLGSGGSPSPRPLAPPLQLLGVERVAACKLARFQAGDEPARALRRGSVREGVGHDVALASPLQTVIADRGRGLHGRLDVAGLDQPPLFLGVVRPYAGEAIGLQLDPHLELVGLGLVQAALHLLHLRQNAEQVLHVMSDFVRDHIGLRELAALAADLAAAETPLEVLEERGVEIDLAVVGTVERTHRGLRESACRAGGAREHDQRGRLVGLAGGGEDLLPLHFRASEHGGNELAHLIGRRLRLASWSGLRLLLLRVAGAGADLAFNQLEGIDTERPTDEAQYDQGADTDAAGTAHRHPARPAVGAPILDIVATRQLVPAHGLGLHCAHNQYYP